VSTFYILDLEIKEKIQRNPINWTKVSERNEEKTINTKILSTRCKPPSSAVLTPPGTNNLAVRSCKEGFHTGGRRNAISALGEAASSVTGHGAESGHCVILSDLQQRSSPPSSRCARRCTAPHLSLATAAGQKELNNTLDAHGEIDTSLGFIEGYFAPLPCFHHRPLE
jgi:hypothetical protein